MSFLEKIEGIQKNVPLSQFTTFQIGGPADYFYEARDIMTIPTVIEGCRKDKLPFILLAWGSNVVFSEKGFRGLVIRNLARKITLGEPAEAVGGEGDDNYRPAGQLLEADSGTLLSQIIQYALKHNLTGMQKMMGIPGSIGGAVRGNAGAYGLEIKHLFEKALVLDPESGEIKEVGPDYAGFSYRHSKFKTNNEIVLKVWLRLIPGDGQAALEEAKAIITSRLGKHPHGPSAGSFFKNPCRNSIGVGQSAGQLIEQSGFKGKHLGGAYISEQHANFLMSDGTATQQDIIKLSREIQKTVWEKFRIKMEREVALVGEHGFLHDEFAPS